MSRSRRPHRRFAAAILLTLPLALTITFHRAPSQPSPSAPAHANHSSHAAAALALGETDTLTPTNCRFGAAYLPDNLQSLPWLPHLGAGWYVNFGSGRPELPDSEFVYTLRLDQLFGPDGRLPEFEVRPPLVYSYLDGGETKPGLGALVEGAPGALWLVGNEIEIDNVLQDNLMPDVYARAYHDVYQYIKGLDPTARVAIGSVTMATPGRLQYLDIVWDTYQSLYGTPMPVDVWNLHLYILPERTLADTPEYADGKIALGTDPALAIRSSARNPDYCPAPGQPDTAENDPRADIYCVAEQDSVRIFRDQVTAFRQWMKDHGQQNRPLIISEYGTLAAFKGGQPDGTCEERKDEFGRCFYPQRVTDFLRGTVQFMEETHDPALGYPADDYRLVQRWLWYSIYTPYLVGDSSNLLDDHFDSLPPNDQDGLSLIGQAYRDETVSRENGANLKAIGVTSPRVVVQDPSARVTVFLKASFQNTGTISVVRPFMVTFYSDAALTQPIASATVDPGQTGPVAGCQWTAAALTVVAPWAGLPVGTHSYWARIDSGDQVGEVDEGDNVSLSGIVTVMSGEATSFQSFVPFAGND